MSGDLFDEITTRNEIARDIVAGFAAVTPPTIAGLWLFVDTALADMPVALAQLRSAWTELEALRLDRDNLLAVILATLAASEDGEDDPLWYLRDELNAHQMPSQRHRGAS